MEEFEQQVNENLARPFAITGRRAYLIGQQDGAFPDMGNHLPGEMGGLWLPPLKIADGFWFGLSQDETSIQWVFGPNCQSFTMKMGRVERIFELELGADKILATQELFIPDYEPGLSISLKLENESDHDLSLRLCWLVRFDIQGSWWSGWPDRPDEAHFDPTTETILSNDSLSRQWCGGMRSSRPPVNFQIGPDLWAAEKTTSLNSQTRPENALLPNPDKLEGQGISGQLNYQVKLEAGTAETLYFALAGGDRGFDFVQQALTNLLEQREVLWKDKNARLETLIGNATIIKTPRPDFDRTFRESSLCLDMLTLDIPALGLGIAAGMPEFVWYFGCDTYYCVSGLLVSGQSETALVALRFLANIARKQGGRVPHEITPSGAIFNPGNTVETAEFVSAVERAYRWTGDQNFLNEVYEVCREGIFTYMLVDCDPQSTLLPDGPGLLELSSAEHGKKFDVACALYQALESLAYLAEVVGDATTAEKSKVLAGQVRDKINEHFWSPERQEYVWRIEPDLTLNPSEPAHSYAALEMGLLPEPEYSVRISQLFQTVESPKHTGSRGIIHPGTADFVMPIQNAIVALAEFRYGRVDKGLWYLERIVELSGYYMPWAIPEFVGRGSCFLQAWSSAANNWLLVQGFFRLNPDPRTGVIFVQPQLPNDWDYAEANNLSIWGGRYDLKLERSDNQLLFSFHEIVLSPQKLRFEVVLEPTLPASFV